MYFNINYNLKHLILLKLNVNKKGQEQNGMALIKFLTQKAQHLRNPMFIHKYEIQIVPTIH